MQQIIAMNEQARVNQILLEDLGFSRRLELSRCCELQSADELVNSVLVNVSVKPTKAQLKNYRLLILDLCAVWLEHPSKKISVPMSNSGYRARENRYNPLSISYGVIECVRALDNAGLVHFDKGFFDRREWGVGRTSRIRASDRLIEYFRQSKLTIYDLAPLPKAEAIILRDALGNDIPYEDTGMTRHMRQKVKAYNALLAETFIDIRRLVEPVIPISDGFLTIGPSRQHVRRVFNRGDFSKGGRFFGPWWQGCPKKWRREIFINDEQTIELDFSSMHVALLYAERGINFNREFKGDAYTIPTPCFLKGPEQTRNYAKLLFLMALNAKSEKETFQAFRSHMRDGGKTGGSLRDHQLAQMLSELRKLHPLIADGLASDAGIRLMNTDSKIAEIVIGEMTNFDVPVLTIHDSFIVANKHEALLRDVLYQAYKRVAQHSGIRLDKQGVGLGDTTSWIKNHQLSDDALVRSNGYMSRLRLFEKSIGRLIIP
jgi:hypothetical protein